MKPFRENIEQLTKENTFFRKVLFTGAHSQLVVMNLLPGQEIAKETHPLVDQFFRIEQGGGKAIIDGVEYELLENTALIVPAGSEHTIINNGDIPLKLYTVYSPANHPPGTIHETIDDAKRAEHDH